MENKFGKKIKNQRLKKKITIKQLVSDIKKKYKDEFSERTYNRYESGTMPKYDRGLNIVSYLFK